MTSHISKQCMLYAGRAIPWIWKTNVPESFQKKESFFKRRDQIKNCYKLRLFLNFPLEAMMSADKFMYKSRKSNKKILSECGNKSWWSMKPVEIIKLKKKTSNKTVKFQINRG